MDTEEGVYEFTKRKIWEDRMQGQLQRLRQPVPELPPELLHLFTPESLAAAESRNQEASVEADRNG